MKDGAVYVQPEMDGQEAAFLNSWFVLLTDLLLNRLSY